MGQMMKHSEVEKMAEFISENWKGWPDDKDLAPLFLDMAKEFDFVLKKGRAMRMARSFTLHIVNQNSHFYYPLHDIRYALLYALKVEGWKVDMSN